MADNPPKLKFNPIKQGNDDNDSIIYQWDTPTVQAAKDALEIGAEIVKSPFYEKNTKLRAPNLVFEISEEEEDEYIDCLMDVHYFASRCKVNTDDGYKEIILRDYQIEMLDNYVKCNRNVVLAARQIGKTIVTAIFLLWFALFHNDKSIMVLSNKGENIKELMNKIKLIFEGLPFHLKAGIETWNEKVIKFDNGSVIKGGTATKDAGISNTIDVLYIDEYAHFPANIIDAVYDQAEPTVSSRKDGRIIITSTPNGRNRFYRICDAAAKGQSTYKFKQVNYNQTPYFNERLGKYILKDDEWKAQKIADVGEDAFAWQYGCSFDSGSNTLLPTALLNKLGKNEIKYVYKEIPKLIDNLSNFDDYDFMNIEELKWHPNFDPVKSLNSTFYYISTDVAEGGGDGDNTAFTIYQLKLREGKKGEKINHKNVYIEQVGTYASNTTPTTTFAKLYMGVCHLMNVGMYKNLIEKNSDGGVLLKDFKLHKKEYKSIFKQFSYTSVLRTKSGTRKVKGRDVPKYIDGLRVDRNKSTFCANTKIAIKNDRIILTDVDVIDEGRNFKKIGSTYKAAFGYDDRWMTVVNSTSILYGDNPNWINFCNDFIAFKTGNKDDRNLFQKAKQGIDDEKRNSAGFVINDPNNVKKRKLLTPEQEKELEFIKEYEEAINSGQSFSKYAIRANNPMVKLFMRFNR